MKRLLRYLICFILLLAVLLIMTACDETPTLAVKSTDYSVSILKASELNDAFFEKYTNAGYDAFYVYVSNTNQYGDAPKMLVINNERDSHLRMISSKGGYFLGLDHTEFASGIYFVPFSGSVMSETHKVSQSRCVGLFDCSMSGEFCYAITAWNCFDEEETIKLCKLFPPNNGESYIEVVCNIAWGDAIACTQDANQNFYVLTPNEFYSVTTDGVVTKIQVPEHWDKLQVTSITEIENTIYIGTKYGVLEYSVSRNVFTWFPVEFDKIVTQ